MIWDQSGIRIQQYSTAKLDVDSAEIQMATQVTQQPLFFGIVGSLRSCSTFVNDERTVR